MCPGVVLVKVEIRYDTYGESVEVNVSDHKYEVEHKQAKQTRNTQRRRG